MCNQHVKLKSICLFTVCYIKLIFTSYDMRKTVNNNNPSLPSPHKEKKEREGKLKVFFMLSNNKVHAFFEQTYIQLHNEHTKFIINNLLRPSSFSSNSPAKRNSFGRNLSQLSNNSYKNQRKTIKFNSIKEKQLCSTSNNK